jgi:WD40 repeat protein
LAFSPDDKTLAAAPDCHGSSAEVVLWEVATGGERCRFPGANAVANSPDGRVLATGGLDHRVHLWELATGRELPPLSGHSGAVEALGFAPDGGALASGSMDATVLTWDGKRLRPAERVRAGPLLKRQLQDLWADLAGADSARAYRAVRMLAGRPDQAVPLLRTMLRSADPFSPPRPAQRLRAGRAIEILE